MKDKIISELSTKLPKELVVDLIESYETVLIEFRKGLWEETLWKAGKFAENVFRILEYLSTSCIVDEIENSKEIKEKLEKIPKDKLPESVRILIPRITSSMIYDPRSKRGAVHVKPINPDYIDAVLTVSACDWIISEFLRLYHTSDTQEIIEIINSLVRRKIPFIEKHEEETFITIDLGCANEILLLLLNSQNGLNRKEISNTIQAHYTQGRITQCLKWLISKRFILKKSDDKYIISGPGENEISKVLARII